MGFEPSMYLLKIKLLNLIKYNWYNLRNIWKRSMDTLYVDSVLLLFPIFFVGLGAGADPPCDQGGHEPTLKLKNIYITRSIYIFFMECSPWILFEKQKI
jgi:hypothetical protein